MVHRLRTRSRDRPAIARRVGQCVGVVRLKRGQHIRAIHRVDPIPA